jgi:hypothetical protein
MLTVKMKQKYLVRIMFRCVFLIERPKVKLKKLKNSKLKEEENKSLYFPTFGCQILNFMTLKNE